MENGLETSLSKACHNFTVFRKLVYIFSRKIFFFYNRTQNTIALLNVLCWIFQISSPIHFKLFHFDLKGKVCSRIHVVFISIILPSGVHTVKPSLSGSMDTRLNSPDNQESSQSKILEYQWARNKTEYVPFYHFYAKITGYSQIIVHHCQS